MSKVWLFRWILYNGCRTILFFMQIFQDFIINACLLIMQRIMVIEILSLFFIMLKRILYVPFFMLYLFVFSFLSVLIFKETSVSLWEKKVMLESIDILLFTFAAWVIVFISFVSTSITLSGTKEKINDWLISSFEF